MNLHHKLTVSNILGLVGVFAPLVFYFWPNGLFGWAYAWIGVSLFVWLSVNAIVVATD